MNHSNHRNQVFGESGISFMLGNRGTFTLASILDNIDQNQADTASETTRASAAEAMLMSLIQSQIADVKQDCATKDSLSKTNSDVSDLRTATNSLLAMINQLSSQLASLMSGTSSSISTLTSNLASTSQKTDGNTQSIGVLMSTVGDHGGQLTGLATQVSSLSGQQAASNGSITALNSRLSTAESNILAAMGVSNVQSGNITSLGGRMGQVEGRTTSLEGRATTVEGRATLLEGRATLLEARTTIVETNVSSHTTSIASLAIDVDYSYQCAAISMVAKKAARSSSNVQGCAVSPIPALNNSVCNASTAGTLRFTVSTKSLDVCSGTAFSSVLTVVCLFD